MGRLVRFVAVEVKAVRTRSQHGRHESSIPPRNGFVRPATVNLGPRERLGPVGFADSDPLPEPGYHVEPAMFNVLEPYRVVTDASRLRMAPAVAAAAASSAAS